MRFHEYNIDSSHSSEKERVGIEELIFIYFIDNHEDIRASISHMKYFIPALIRYKDMRGRNSSSSPIKSLGFAIFSLDIGNYSNLGENLYYMSKEPCVDENVHLHKNILCTEFSRTQSMSTV